MAPLSSVPLVASFITSALAVPLHSRSQSGDHYTLPTEHLAKSINFTSCDESAGFIEGLQCATYSVPIDWDHPKGEHFNLGLVRIPASTNSTSYIGPLFINPGGPGGSASALVNGIAAGGLGSAAEILLDSFDIIGLDPRGVSLSSQVQCDMNIFAENVTLFPTTQDEFDALVDHNKRYGESCRNLTGPLLEHLDTISAAKDHEAVRIALGNYPMNFQGESYGSQLGAQYAQLFPNNIRVLSLDGILQHSQGEAANLFIESSGYELGLTHFLAWAETDEASALKGLNATGVWYDVLANATESPIPALSCNGTTCSATVTKANILINAQGDLITASNSTDSGNWGHLASSLFNASQGDASGFATQYDPTSDAVPATAISCLDWTHESSNTLAGVLAKKHMLEEHYPLTQGASQSWTIQQGCIGWPITVKNPPKKLDVNVKGNVTVLLTVSDADPSTAYPWAVGMQEEIRNYALVTRIGNGHTSLGLGGETTQVIGEYLLTGQAPENGLITSS